MSDATVSRALELLCSVVDGGGGLSPRAGDALAAVEAAIAELQELRQLMEDRGLLESAALATGNLTAEERLGDLRVALERCAFVLQAGAPKIADSSVEDAAGAGGAVEPLPPTPFVA